MVYTFARRAQVALKGATPAERMETTLVSFEDLYGGPFDFNDLSFSFTNTAAADLNGVPEPGSLALWGLGLAAIAVSRKRKQA